jgi:hypothetical protein
LAWSSFTIFAIIPVASSRPSPPGRSYPALSKLSGSEPSAEGEGGAKRRVRAAGHQLASPKGVRILDCATISAAVAEVLNDVIGADAFDVMPDPEGNWVDIAYDRWTLHVEGSPVTTAWVAIDDEPEDAERLHAARRAAMPLEIDQALAIANMRLGGELVSALSASHDPLSLDLATAIGGTVLWS